jgi:hypothetical protein
MTEYLIGSGPANLTGLILSAGIPTDRPEGKGPRRRTSPLQPAEWFNAKACGRSLAGIAGLNPAEGVGVCLLWVFFCEVEASATGRSLVQRSPTDCGMSLCVM